MRRALLMVPILLAAEWAPGLVTFKDASGRAGIGSVIVSGGPNKNYVLEVNGSGVCWIDYDNDGWMDLYLAHSTTVASRRGKEPQRTTSHLYRTKRDGP